MMISINSKDLSAWHADITSSKSDNELLLFGEEVNSMIEFYQEPSSYSSSPTAIRMAKVYYDDNHRYIIQACHIENYENVWKDLEQKYPLLPVDTIGPLKTAKKQQAIIKARDSMADSTVILQSDTNPVAYALFTSAMAVQSNTPTRGNVVSTMKNEDKN